MKKIITILILSLLFTQVSADYCGQGHEKNSLPATCVAYEYIKEWEKVYIEIFVPENIHYYEWLANTNKLSVTSYEWKLININTILIKKGLKPIY